MHTRAKAGALLAVLLLLAVLAQVLAACACLLALAANVANLLVLANVGTTAVDTAAAFTFVLANAARKPLVCALATMITSVTVLANSRATAQFTQILAHAAVRATPDGAILLSVPYAVTVL